MHVIKIMMLFIAHSDFDALLKNKRNTFLSADGGTCESTCVKADDGNITGDKRKNPLAALLFIQ